MDSIASHGLQSWKICIKNVLPPSRNAIGRRRRSQLQIAIVTKSSNLVEVNTIGCFSQQEPKSRNRGTPDAKKLRCWFRARLCGRSRNQLIPSSDVVSCPAALRIDGQHLFRQDLDLVRRSEPTRAKAGNRHDNPNVRFPHEQLEFIFPMVSCFYCLDQFSPQEAQTKFLSAVRFWLGRFRSLSVPGQVLTTHLGFGVCAALSACLAPANLGLKFYGSIFSINNAVKGQHGIHSRRASEFASIRAARRFCLSLLCQPRASNPSIGRP